ncbi:MAG: preprotein translocase subunit SecG [Eubacterium sp.]|nr:preprotein translocase subunit SecG [Eubacterium sp.]
MSTLKMIATIAYIVICIALVIVVLMQEGKTTGLGALGGAADTYWSKNKGRSQEGVLIKITRVLAILFVALSVVLCTSWLD